MKLRKTLKNQKGMTIAEVLIAAVLSMIVIAAGFEFYVTQHRAWLMQGEVSDVQHNARSCLDEIAGRLKMAGFGITGHPSYTSTTGYLAIYTQVGADIDTVQYLVVPKEGDEPVLLCKLPGEDPTVYAEGVENLVVTVIAPGLLQVRLTCRSEREEAEFLGGDGYRRRELVTEVRARNLSI